MTQKLIVGTLLVSACLVLSGCEVGNDAIARAAPRAVSNSVDNVVVLTTNDVALAVVIEWPSYFAPVYFQHGTANEETYRSSAISAARAQGLDCIKVECPDPPSDELAMHLLHFEHPARPGYFLGVENWYNKAQAQGINRYVFDIGNASDSTIARWQYLTKAYPANSLQWVVNGQVKSSLLP
ncbi:MAG: hypothetical protein WCL16_01350 [bacterium]